MSPAYKSSGLIPSTGATTPTWPSSTATANATSDTSSLTVWPSSHPARSAKEIKDRCFWLLQINNQDLGMRHNIRTIMNGGQAAVELLVGDSDAAEFMPTANLMLSGLERLAQRSGAIPTVRVDPPADNESARKKQDAELREEFVETMDKHSRLSLLMPQLVRWIIGYGFAPVVMGTGVDTEGNPYPNLQLRDPYSTFLSPWGPHQHPDDMLVVRRVPEKTLEDLYPAQMKKRRMFSERGQGGAFLMGGANNHVGLNGSLLSGTGNSGYENPQDDGLTVWEYYDSSGRYLLLEDSDVILDFIPAPAGVRRMFHVFKRYSFDKLQGQYDHAIGVMGMMAKMTVLQYLDTLDGVFSETNIYGQRISQGEYKRGRFAINEFTEGTRVERVRNNVPFEQFQQIDRLERQLRQVSAYPVTDDAQSPNSFVTGQGLRELTTASENVTQELFLVIANGLEDLDAARLLWVEKCYPERRYETHTQRSFVPGKNIKGKHVTRRIYGLMAGLDSSAKTIGLLNLNAAGLIDKTTVQENLDGIDNVQKVQDRKRVDDVRETLQQLMLGAATGQAQLNPQILQVLVAQLPQGKERELYENIFFPEAEEPLEAAPAQPQEPEALAQPGESTSTVLARLTGSGADSSGIQTVSEVG